ncbi:MAG: hypothetical protein IKU40_01055 [Clostridia bacterium]|nr:hypothetical protein [Clostridia bacterium]
MKTKFTLLFAAALLLACASCGKAEPASDNVTPTPETRIAAENYISPSSVYAAEDGTVYAADETGGRVIRLGADGSIAAQIDLEGGAHCVKVHDGKVYVTRGGLDGTLTVLSADLKIEKEYPVGHTPTDVEFAGNIAYVTNRFSDTVTAIDLTTDGDTSTFNVSREPIAAAIANGKLYVACHLPDDAANEDVVSASVHVFHDLEDVRTVRYDGVIELVNGTGGVKDIEATPDGSRLFVSAVIARYQYPTTQLDGAWINSNGFAIIDAATDSYVNTILLDDVTLGAASPWGIAFDEENAYFAASGTGEIISFPMNKLDAAMKAGRELADEIGLLSAVRTRTQLPGEGVRDIMLRDGKLYCTEYFTGDIAVLNTSDLSISTLSLGEQPEADIVRLGETLWYDATKCYQNWEACASCHPDGRVDGFNWDNLNDGLGNPKSAVSMMYTFRCPPVMITGIRADAGTAVRAGMKFIQFNTIDEESNRAIDEYLKSMLPEESPALELGGTLTETAAEGKELFEQYGCVQCHPAPLYTDLKHHTSPILGKDGGWENRDFATPTLVEVWRSAPYMYNGSAKTIEDAVRHFVPEGTSDDDVAKISEFVRSIGTEGEDYGVEQVFWTGEDGTEGQGRPAAGSTLTGFTVRCQAENAVPAYADVTLITDDGRITCRYSLGEMAYNTAAYVDLSAESLYMRDGRWGLEINFADKKGNPLASPYVLTVKEN